MGAQQNNPFSNATAGQPGDNSGVPGVTQTNGKFQSVPQIDPTQALAFFAQAGQTEAAGYNSGNAAYQQSLQTAAKEMNAGFLASDETLRPLSTASNQALTLFQQMLGITPANPTANMGNDLLSIDPSLGAIASKINQANATDDPTQRATMLTAINQQLGTAGTQGVTAAQAALTALGPNYTIQNPGPGLTYIPNSSGGSPIQAGQNDIITSAIQPGSLNKPGGPWINSAVEPVQSSLPGGDTITPILQQNQADWQAKQTPLQDALTQAQATQGELQNFQNTFDANFTPTVPKGFTGQQATQMLENTPGYQFQLGQGDQQVLRNQAAIGNLGTGGTQVALTNYGQGLAQNTYNGFMSDLGALIGSGANATMQLGVNQVNQGGYLSNLTQLSGQANQAAAIGAGNAIGASQNQQGTTAYNAAALNTQLQFDTFMANMAQQASAASANSMQSPGINGSQNSSGAGFYQGMQMPSDNASNLAESQMAQNFGGVSNGGDANTGSL